MSTLKEIDQKLRASKYFPWVFFVPLGITVTNFLPLPVGIEVAITVVGVVFMVWVIWQALKPSAPPPPPTGEPLN